MEADSESGTQGHQEEETAGPKAERGGKGLVSLKRAAGCGRRGGQGVRAGWRVESAGVLSPC